MATPSKGNRDWSTPEAREFLRESDDAFKKVMSHLVSDTEQELDTETSECFDDDKVQRILARFHRIKERRFKRPSIHTSSVDVPMLTRPQRQVLYLYGQGSTLDQIAAQLQMSREQVEQLFESGTQRLASILAPLSEAEDVTEIRITRDAERYRGESL